MFVFKNFGFEVEKTYFNLSVSSGDECFTKQNSYLAMPCRPKCKVMAFKE